MSNDQNPRTARDALIIELLGDLGVVHDEIKKLPNQLKDSLRESLTLIADAVQEAENTTQKLAAGYSETLKSETDAHIQRMNEELSKQIKATINAQLNNELNSCAETIGNIRNTLLQFPTSFRPKMPVWPFAVFGIVIAGMAWGMFSMYQHNDNTLRETMKVYTIFQKQQDVIRTLPPEMQKKFQ